MATPAEALEEAIGQLDSWQPTDGKALYEFIKGLPDVLDKFGASLGGLFERADENGDLEETLGEEMGQLQETMNNAQGAADELSQQFHHHYKFFLNGDS